LKLLSRVEQQLLERGQFLPDKYYGPSHLRREQEQIGYISAVVLSLFGFIDQ
jgi:hypothetical protein